MSRGRGLLAAVALILATNLVVLGGVVFNRTGKPDAVLTLTERELPMVGRSREDTGVALDLRWEHLGAGYRAGEAPWLDRHKLESLGFDCGMPENDPRAEAFYRKALPRKAYVVLEYEGKAWKDALREKEEVLREHDEKIRQGAEPPQQAESARADLELTRNFISRLFPVDVGSDPASLRQTYPDRSRYILAEGKVGLRWETTYEQRENGKYEPGPARLQGGILEISIPRIHVPRGKAVLLEALMKKDEAEGPSPGPGLHAYPLWHGEREPRYRVRVSFGRRLEPWVEKIEPLVPAPQTGSGGKE